MARSLFSRLISVRLSERRRKTISGVVVRLFAVGAAAVHAFVHSGNARRRPRRAVAGCGVRRTRRTPGSELDVRPRYSARRLALYSARYSGCSPRHCRVLSALQDRHQLSKPLRASSLRRKASSGRNCRHEQHHASSFGLNVKPQVFACASLPEGCVGVCRPLNPCSPRPSTVSTSFPLRLLTFATC
jgi:hypothetical protein